MSPRRKPRPEPKPVPKPKRRAKPVEVEVEVPVTDARDFTMARVASALASIEGVRLALLETLTHMLDGGDDDKDGSKREELLDEADELLGHASRAVQLAQASWEDADEDDALAEEPDEWNGEEPDEDEDDEDDEDDDDGDDTENS